MRCDITRPTPYSHHEDPHQRNGNSGTVPCVMVARVRARDRAPGESTGAENRGIRRGLLGHRMRPLREDGHIAPTVPKGLLCRSHRVGKRQGETTDQVRSRRHSTIVQQSVRFRRTVGNRRRNLVARGRKSRNDIRRFNKKH